MFKAAVVKLASYPADKGERMQIWMAAEVLISEANLRRVDPYTP